MAFDSFRGFINLLEKSGELNRLTQPVATELEITELADREMKSPGGGKALLIDRPTVNGAASPFPVAINTMGSSKRMALSLGADSVAQVANELGSLMKAKPPVSFRETLKLLSTAMDLRHAKRKLGRAAREKKCPYSPPPPPRRRKQWQNPGACRGGPPASGAVGGVPPAASPSPG